MDFSLKYSRFNERSILIEWPSIIDENILDSVLNFKNNIENYYIEQKVEIINTYSSILIIYDITIDNINDELFSLKRLFEEQKIKKQSKTTLWEIPVCYDDEFSMDLENLAMQKQLSKSEIIRLHTNEVYTVYFIGFLPGFLYLGGLDSKLYFDRKSTPNLNIKKGSVAIGGKQTGIYPQDSPGGWHIIGKTPINLFNSLTNPPCKIGAGDRVKFIPVNRTTYASIAKLVKQDVYQIKYNIANA